MAGGSLHALVGSSFVGVDELGARGKRGGIDILLDFAGAVSVAVFGKSEAVLADLYEEVMRNSEEDKALLLLLLLFHGVVWCCYCSHNTVLTIAII